MTVERGTARYVRVDEIVCYTAGLVLGVVIEWSTLFVASGLKLVVGFLILIIVLIIRPQGIFGQARAV